MAIRDLTPIFNARFGLSKTDSQIRCALHNHRITCGRKGGARLIPHLRVCTKVQAEFIEENYRLMTVKDLAAALTDKFGVVLTERQINTFIKNHGITSGRTGRFEKEHTPWNNGTKGKGLTGRNKTSFRKGNVPPNRRPLWSERIDSKDGFILIKVPETDPYTGFPTRFKLKHVWIWEQANGPVPKGMNVAFKDSNKLNCVLENLMLVSDAELLRLNQHGYREMPEELKPSILALSRLETKMFSRAKDHRQQTQLRTE